jgi:hypothetical protein
MAVKKSIKKEKVKSFKGKAKVEKVSAKSKKTEKEVKVKEEKKEDEGGMSLDDAFADDEDVEYAPSKPRKEKKKTDEELEEELDEAEEEIEEVDKMMNGSAEPIEVAIRASKPIAQVKKGDKIKVDGKQLEVDAHYVLIDHGATKEMAIELFDPNSDKDFQLRYFSDQVETSLEFYELADIMYLKRIVKAVEW